MLKNMSQTNPHADFVIADFSFFLESYLESQDSVEINRPIISIKGDESHEKTDFKTIIDPEIGTSDIFYQTDFEFLKLLVKEIFNKEVVKFLTQRDRS
jgi:hypothetical protein